MANKTVILSIALGAVVAGAVGVAVTVGAREKEAKAAEMVSGILDGPSPFGLHGATLTHGPVTVGVSGATIPAFMLVLADGTTVASPTVSVDGSSSVDARDVTVTAPGGRGTLVSARMTAKADGASGELHGVRFADVRLSEQGGGIKGAAAEIDFESLSRHAARGIEAKGLRFTKADGRGNAEIDIALLTLDGVSAGSGDADLGARRLALSGITMPSEQTKGAGAESVVIEASPHTGNVTSLSLSVKGITSPTAANPGDAGKGNLEARADRAEGGVRMTFSLTGTQLPDIRGEQAMSGTPPLSLLERGSPEAHLVYSGGRIEFQDVSGRFGKLLALARAGDGTHPGMDPGMLLPMASAIGGVDPRTLDPVKDWLTDPSRKMEVLFSPPPTPGARPGVTVTVLPSVTR